MDKGTKKIVQIMVVASPVGISSEADDLPLSADENGFMTCQMIDE